MTIIVLFSNIYQLYPYKYSSVNLQELRQFVIFFVTGCVPVFH